MAMRNSQDTNLNLSTQYGCMVKIVNQNGKKFIGRLHPNGNRRSQGKLDNAKSRGKSRGNITPDASADNGIPEVRSITRKSKLSRVISEKRYDDVRKDELIVINAKGKTIRFSESQVTRKRLNQMPSGKRVMRMEITYDETT